MHAQRRCGGVDGQTAPAYVEGDAGRVLDLWVGQSGHSSFWILSGVGRLRPDGVVGWFEFPIRGCLLGVLALRPPNNLHIGILRKDRDVYRATVDDTGER